MTTSPSPANGQNKILWWISGALLGPIVLAVFGNLMNTTYASVQRLSALEATFRELHLDLDCLERKVDQLLDRK